jgi:SMI1 / KNR4 family (SUKH-1)
MYEWILDTVERSIEVFHGFSLECGMHLGEPATTEEIHQCEQAIGLELPHSYKEFLLIHNGAHLFSDRDPQYAKAEEAPWWSDSGTVILGLESLLSYRKTLMWTYELCDFPVRPFPIPIAYLGRSCTGEFCALDMTSLNNLENPVMYCEHDRDPSEWKDFTIASSFEDWLHKTFEAVIDRKNFPEYWSEENL